MKEEALKLADELNGLNSCEPVIIKACETMIRRLVEELDCANDYIKQYQLEVAELKYKVLELTKRYKALDRDDAVKPKQLEFHSIAGMTSKYYEGMVEATVAVGADYTLSLICDEEVKDKVAQMFTPQTNPLSDEEIKEVEQQVDKQYAEELIYRQDEWVYLFARAIEERHGIK